MSFELTSIRTRLAWLYHVFCLVMIVIFASKLIAEEDTIQNRNNEQRETESKEPSSTENKLPGDQVSSFDRIVTLYTTIASAETDDLLALLNEPHEIADSGYRYEKLFAIASQLTIINPQEALELLSERTQNERGAFIKGIFTEWSVSDLDEAVAAAETLDRSARLTALMAIVEVRDDLTAGKLNAIARKLGHPDYAAHWESQTKAIELADDPTAAWSVLIHDGLDNLSQLHTLVLVAEAAVEQQGLDVLFHLQAPFADDFRSWGEPHYFDSVLESLITNDPQIAWAYIQTGATNTRDVAPESSRRRNNNEFSQRDRDYMSDVAQTLLVRSWAEMDPNSILSRIEQIPRHLQQSACERALAALVATEPERTVELIQSLKSYGSSSADTLRRVIWSWAQVDPSATLDWALFAPEIDEVSDKDYLMRKILESLVLEDPKRALRAAALQPDSDYIQIMVISALAEDDVDAAVGALPLVSSSAKEYSTNAVAYELAKRGELDRGMELLRQYEESEKEEMTWHGFFRGWLNYDSVHLYEHLDELDPKHRIEAAKVLDYEFLPGFTKKQLDYVRSIIENQSE